MNFRILDIVEDPILAGAGFGRQSLGKLLERVEEPAKPEVCFLDFAGIQVATASYLRESVVGFRDFVRNRRSQLYPVVANASQRIVEELEDLLTAKGDVILSCNRTTSGEVSNVKLLGKLDPKQELTFKLVSQYGETDASTLMNDPRNGEQREDIKQTAWNNRLSSLVSKALIMEISNGRSKRYRPLLSEGA
ncbi:MAG: hypothetical protein KIT79_11720 [Deltaproteobacteria bacterium]|nr:hypothetical protein [Deltaproteobacteria bacterium]